MAFNSDERDRRGTCGLASKVDKKTLAIPETAYCWLLFTTAASVTMCV